MIETERDSERQQETARDREKRESGSVRRAIMVASTRRRSTQCLQCLFLQIGHYSTRYTEERRASLLFLHELLPDQVGVDTIRSHQRGVGASLRHHATIHADDLIGVLDR